MNRFLLAAAIAGFILMGGCNKEVRPLTADTPVVVGDYGSAVIESNVALPEFTAVTGKIIVHPDGKRKWSTIRVDYGASSTPYTCNQGPCDVQLTFNTGATLHVYTKKKQGMVIESGADFTTYNTSDNNRWVLANSGKVSSASVKVDGGDAQPICQGGQGDCKVTISYAP